MWLSIKNFFKNLFKKTPQAAPLPIPDDPHAFGNTQRISNLERGYELIKKFEGCRLKAYPDPGTGGDPWTIGWGHTGPDVFPGLTITQAQADSLFEKDIKPRVKSVKEMIKREYTDDQLCALLSFAYNCGTVALQKSTLLRYFNEGKTLDAADQFLLWNRAGGRILSGLTKRRQAERELFLGNRSALTGP